MNIINRPLSLLRLSKSLKSMDLTKMLAKNLYTAEALGLNGFLATKEKTKLQFDGGKEEKFREKMNEFITSPTNNIVFTEDLKNMVHLAERNEGDITLVKEMLKKFNSQNKELRFGNYIFGPVILRMFHNLNDFESAQEVFTNESVGDLFDQLISYQLLLDMLYENKKYKEVREVFEMIRSRQLQGGRYPKHCVVLAFGACYKENTPESFAYMKQLWSELGKIGHQPMRKGVTFASALAIAQKEFHIGLELACSVRQQNYVTARNLKVLALAELGRLDDVLPILRGVLETDVAVEQQKQTFCKEVIERVAEVFKQSNNKELQQEFTRIEKHLKDNQYISDKTLDDILCTQVSQTPMDNQNRDRRTLAASFNGNKYQSDNRYNKRQPYQNRNLRPGLGDLY
jgi:pentatricopeptide repeat domain-containing protein 2